MLRALSRRAWTLHRLERIPPSKPCAPTVYLHSNASAKVTSSHRCFATVVSPPFNLRPYQVDCLKTILNVFDNNQNDLSRIGVSAPAGCGKGAIIGHLIPLLPKRFALRSPDQKANKVLIIVGTIMLAQQTVNVLQRLNPTLRVEIEQGFSHASREADVQVATYQALTSSQDSRLLMYQPEKYKAIIIDEAHNVPDPYLSRVLAHFDPQIAQVTTRLLISDRFQVSEHEVKVEDRDRSGIAPLEPVRAKAFATTREGRVRVPMIGFTATFSRGDRQSLGRVFEKIVWHASWIAMMHAGYLAPLKFLVGSPELRAAVQRCHKNSLTGNFSSRPLAKICDQTEVNVAVVELWKAQAASKRRSTLVFAIDRMHIRSLVNEFQHRGVDARGIDSSMKPLEHQDLMTKFARGEFPVLINCRLLIEGIDMPYVDCILLARPTLDSSYLQQAIGRGTRHSLETGKKDCLVIDTFGTPVESKVCDPTLFGIDPATGVHDKMWKRVSTLPKTERGLTPVSDLSLPVEEAFPVVSVSPLDWMTAKAIDPEKRSSWLNIDRKIRALALPGAKGGGIDTFLEIGLSAKKGGQQWEIRIRKLKAGGSGSLSPAFETEAIGSHSDLEQLETTTWSCADLLSNTELETRTQLQRAGRSSKLDHSRLTELVGDQVKDGKIGSEWVTGRKGSMFEVKKLTKAQCIDVQTRAHYRNISAEQTSA